MYLYLIQLYIGGMWITTARTDTQESAEDWVKKFSSYGYEARWQKEG